MAIMTMEQYNNFDFSDNEAVIDYVEKHLLEQGGRSIDCDGECAYRGENGTACAIGCLIPNEMYDEGIENHAYDDAFDIIRCNTGDSSLLNINNDVAYRIQIIHDSFCEGSWIDQLKSVRKRHSIPN
ncbi:hypothetical protein N9137_02140 [Pseudomonadales bacterium]|nr:hypothetical protein [Pseudomonadales bacterium]